MLLIPFFYSGRLFSNCCLIYYITTFMANFGTNRHPAYPSVMLFVLVNCEGLTPTIELCGAVFNVCTSVLLCGYTVVKDNISTRSHSLIQLGQFLQAGH
jgi:hypothetical protein